MNKSLRSSAAVIADAGFARLKEHIIALTGLAYYTDKDADLADRISRRLSQSNGRDCRTYLELLRDPVQGEVELDKLIAELTIGETFFFRHHEMFDALRDLVLPDVIGRNQANRRLRIWSAGCSIGAEPYTVSILLNRELAHLVSGWEITILGTDINREFLARAREGCYEEWAFRSVPEDVKRACFEQTGRTWQIAPHFKRHVAFQYHNMVEHPYPSLVHNLFAFDLILCRNVMIYFNQEIIRRIVGRFQQCLVDGGWLLVGHAEPNTETFREFCTVNAAGAVLYQKKQSPTVTPPFISPALAQPEAPPHAVSNVAWSWTPPNLDQLPAVNWPPTAVPVEAVSQTAAASLPELEAIRLLADQGQLEQAAQSCQRLLETNKLNPAVHFYYALILEQMGQHQQMQEALKRAVYLDRNYVLAHYYLGLTLQKLDQDQRAVRSFRNVLQLLSKMDHAQPIPDADDLTVADLEKLTHMHLEALKQP